MAKNTLKEAVEQYQMTMFDVQALRDYLDEMERNAWAKVEKVLKDQEQDYVPGRCAP